MSTDDRLLPVRMLNEYAYCPRLFHLEYVQGEFEDSADTLEGEFAHRRLREGGEVAPPGEGVHDGVFAKSLLLSSTKWGIIGKMDVVESAQGRVCPVEYKRGSVPEVEGGAWEPEKVQLCAQGLILRDGGYTCEEGVIYYAESNRRVEVPFTDDLVSRTVDLIALARKAASSPSIPPPLSDSPKCPRCSLVEICLPDEVNMLAVGQNEGEEVRRLFPARQDSLPLYVHEQGAVVGKSGELVTIVKQGREMGKARLIDTSQLCLFGKVMVTPDAVRALSERSIPICYFSYGGWFYAMTHGMGNKNVGLRVLQFRAREDEQKALRASRAFTAGKIKNCRTMLRRNHPNPPPNVLLELSRLAGLASRADSVEALLGIEGAAAQAYFGSFSGMIKGKSEEEGRLTFHFQERNRRPPRDPVNSLLSFVYALLAKDVTVVALSVGFDPYLGLYHKLRYGRPGLALDLMEEFRPLICDSVVLSLINTEEVKADDFVRRAAAVALTPSGRRKVIEAYHRRLESLVTHPLFGYTISYNRLLEVQARLLGRWLAGEIPDYVPFCTR